jgi:hypothetical protein
MEDNYGDGEDDAISTAVGALVAALALIAVALRFYARHTTAAGIKWDDWLILLAFSTTIVADALVLVC